MPRVDTSGSYRRVQLPEGEYAPGLNFDFARQKIQAQQESKLAQTQPTQTSAFPVAQPEGIKKSIQERILSITGGNILGRGLGLGIAQKGTKQAMDELQQGEGEMQQRLIEAIRKNRMEGKDTSRLEASLNALTSGIADTANNANDLYTEGITNKQVVGDALQLGTTVGTIGALPGAAKSVATNQTISAGIKTGAKAGAKAGVGVGAASGFAQGLKKDKSLADSIKEAAIGAATGAVGGAVIGGVAGGATTGFKQLKKAATTSSTKADNIDDIASLVSPKATDKMKVQALKEGRVTEKSLLQSSKILPSKRDKKLAEVVKDIVSTSKSPTQNIDALNSKVSSINKGVKTYVKANKLPFNEKQLRTQLNKGKDDLNLVFASDAQAEKTYNAVVKEFLKHVSKKDTSGLLDARQGFDKVPAIKKLLDSERLGENTKKEVVLTVRDRANKYIAQLLPEGNKYRDDLLRESKMLEAIRNIAESNSGEVDLNKLQILAKEYPVLKWIVSGLVGAGGVGIGSTIIGSSD